MQGYTIQKYEKKVPQDLMSTILQQVKKIVFEQQEKRKQNTQKNQRDSSRQEQEKQREIREYIYNVEETQKISQGTQFQNLVNIGKVQPIKPKEKPVQEVMEIRYESIRQKLKNIESQYEMDRQLEENGIEGSIKDNIKNKIFDNVISETIKLIVSSKQKGQQQSTTTELNKVDIQQITSYEIKEYKDSINQSLDYLEDFDFVY